MQIQNVYQPSLFQRQKSNKNQDLIGSPTKGLRHNHAITDIKCEQHQFGILLMLIQTRKRKYITNLYKKEVAITSIALTKLMPTREIQAVFLSQKKQLNELHDDDDSDNSNRNGRGQNRRSKFMKRDTNKIKTNPKYKCIDVASEDENAISKNNLNDDGQQQSSKELQFRENFLKFERRKKKKERKQKEKELKKIKALNGEDSSMVSIEEATGRSTGTAGGSTGDDDESLNKQLIHFVYIQSESSESSSSSSSEESKELHNKNTRNNMKNIKSKQTSKFNVYILQECPEQPKQKQKQRQQVRQE